MSDNAYGTAAGDTTELIEELRAAGISVEFTDHRIEFHGTRESGSVLATVGLLTITRTGRVFVELFESSDNVQLTMLEHLERDAGIAAASGYAATALKCWLHPDTVLELREWAEFRDSVLADVA